MIKIIISHVRFCMVIGVIYAWDNRAIFYIDYVQTEPDKLQAKKCSHGAGRIRARNYLLNFVVVMSL